MGDVGGSTAAPGAGGRPLRGMLRRRPERYAFLLILLAADVVIFFTVPAGRWWAFLGVPFVAATLLLGLYTTQVPRRALIVAWIAAFSASGLALAGALLRTTSTQGVAYLLMGLLIVATPILILRRLLGHERVTVQTILGAVCVYVLIGLVFAFLFIGVNGVSSQPFLAQGANDRPATYVYLSYITLATVGYGDYTPAGTLGQALCAWEAIMGQIFLVTTVARLVSLYGSKAPLRPEDEAGGGS
jgi:Ion channel